MQWNKLKKKRERRGISSSSPTVNTPLQLNPYYNYLSKRETLKYDLNVNYTKKYLAQKCVDYLGLTYFKTYFWVNININNYLSNFNISEL